MHIYIYSYIIFSTAAELSTESTNIRILILRRVTRAASCSLSLSTCISLLLLHDPSYSNSLLLSRRFCKGVLQEGLQHCLESSCSGSAPASSIRFLHPGSDPKMTKIISVYCCGSMMYNDVQCVCVWGFSGKSKANSLRSAWNNRSTRWILTSLPPHQQHTFVAAAAPFAATNLGANNTLMLSDPLSSWQVLWQARVLARDNECIHELQWTIQRIREQKAS